ncbi:MAG: FAD-binding oxidoreductase [Pseudomonadota bacterium]
MDLLYANDRRGTYPRSWYAATANLLEPFAPLRGELRADVCIIGAGYTGLSAALHLAEMGRDVVLLDAQRVGFGASGRNGGQLGSGQRVDQLKLEQMLEPAHARALWELGQDAKALVKSLIKKHDIDCNFKPGVMLAASKQRDVDDLHREAAHLQSAYDYDQIEALDQTALTAICRSPEYKGGTLDMGAGHLHPLNYALGLAKAADGAGARIHEQSHVRDIAHGRKTTVRTDEGSVTADHLIIACNGYLGGLDPTVAARVMPINNFIAATEPLGADQQQVLTQDIAVADCLFVLNYFRLSHDGRLLFGGGESYGYRFPTDIAATVRRPLSVIFPQLKDIPLDYAWGGTLGITMKRLPFFTRLSSNTLSASGYSGHGVGSATQAGSLLAQAIVGASDGFDTLARIPSTPFPGGVRLRSPLLTLAMTWYALRDRLGI